MARTNATNFSGALQFPYATAATDLFKKEDVQTLALAVDGHDHSSGKGLILPLSAIPTMDAAHLPPITSAMIQDGTITSADIADGTITSAKILDGTLDTIDLAANAVSQYQIYAISRGGTTTSSSPVALSPPASVTLTTTGGPCLVFANLGFYMSPANTGITVYVQRDAGIWTAVANAYASTLNLPIMGGGWFVDVPAAGSHTWQIGWATASGGGTATVSSQSLTQLLVVEHKR